MASLDDLYAALEAHKPGDTVKVRFLRGDQALEVEVRLDEPR